MINISTAINLHPCLGPFVFTASWSLLRANNNNNNNMGILTTWGMKKIIRNWSVWRHEVITSEVLYHTTTIITPTVGESILKMCSGQVCCPVVLRCCVHSLMHFNGGKQPPKIASPLRGTASLSNTRSLGQSEFSSQTARQSGQPFLCSWPETVLIFHNVPDYVPQNCPFPLGRSGPPPDTRSTQPCIPPRSLNWVPAVGLKVGMSPLPGGR